MKICSRCKVEKDESQFSKRTKAADGLQRHCKACHKEMMGNTYRANPSYYKNKAKDYRQNLLEFIRKSKEKPCVDCGVQYHFAAMDFDHLRDKEFNLSSGWTKGLQLVKKEIEKCEVVCSNCHRVRTYNRMNNTLEAQLEEQLPTKEQVVSSTLT